MMAISNKNIEIFSLLLNGVYFLWKAEHLKIIVREIINTDWNSQALGEVISGKCFSSIINDLDNLEQKLAFLEDLFSCVFQVETEYKPSPNISSLDEEELKRDQQAFNYA
jgi:hypothetical protein